MDAIPNPLFFLLFITIFLNCINPPSAPASTAKTPAFSYQANPSPTTKPPYPICLLSNKVFTFFTIYKKNKLLSTVHQTFRQS
jgi:hypothetical protein